MSIDLLSSRLRCVQQSVTPISFVGLEKKLDGRGPARCEPSMGTLPRKETMGYREGLGRGKVSFSAGCIDENGTKWSLVW